MASSDDIGGVWRTVGGRRIFIKDGQNIKDAMKKSGKFKELKEKIDINKVKAVSVKNKEDLDKVRENKKIAKEYAEELREKAKENDEKITNDMKEIAAEGDGTVNFAIGEKGALEFRIKGQGSLERKLFDKAKAKGIEVRDYKPTDVLRYTNVSEPDKLVKDFNSFKSNLENRGYKMIECTNTMNYVGVDYRGINTLVQDRNGYVFELQFHTPESLKTKEEKVHPIYEKARTTTNKEEKQMYMRQMIEISNRIETPIGIEKNKRF